MAVSYQSESITRGEADSLVGATVLQFGTNWCGYCQAGAEVIEPALAGVADVRRVLVEDGKGRPLGRSYRVKLWPTLIFLADGTEVSRVVLPERDEDVTDALGVLIEDLDTETD